MSVRVRFAPSPTGYLHLGNARTALMNWLFARHHRGEFFLRFDDTDRQRCQGEYFQDIQDSLLWLGLEWDHLLHQSAQENLYLEKINHLKALGRIYPCYETPEELEEKRAANLKKGLPPLYDRESLYHPKPHGSPHWRFLLEHTSIEWQDLIQEHCAHDTRHLSDPIILREDGTISYLLASVVDDIHCRITHVIRGADHLANTAIQIQMFQALQAPLPTFAHFSLMTDSEGHKISKRGQAIALKDLRAKGFFPLALCQTLASLGLSTPLSGDLLQMASAFHIEDYGRSVVQLDLEKITQANRALLHKLSYEEIAPWAPPLLQESLWYVIRDNLSSIEDIAFWENVCHGTLHIEQTCPDSMLYAQALTFLPPQPWDETTWDLWIGRILEASPSYRRPWVAKQLRLALTGRAHGPQMKFLMPLMEQSCLQTRLAP